MTIVIPKEARKEAIASIERYFRENMDEPIGNLAAGTHFAAVRSWRDLRTKKTR